MIVYQHGVVGHVRQPGIYHSAHSNCREAPSPSADGGESTVGSVDRYVSEALSRPPDNPETRCQAGVPNEGEGRLDWFSHVGGEWIEHSDNPVRADRTRADLPGCGNTGGRPRTGRNSAVVRDVKRTDCSISTHESVRLRMQRRPSKSRLEYIHLHRTAVPVPARHQPRSLPAVRVAAHSWQHGRADRTLAVTATWGRLVSYATDSERRGARVSAPRKRWCFG